MEAPGTLTLDWATQGRRLPGQEEMGDACWTHRNGPAFRLAVVDGLGHGRDAAAAAHAALQVLEANPLAPLDGQMRLCHEALRRTRGAAISLAELDLAAARLSWTGVGNVEGLLARGSAGGPARERLLLKSGIVGYNLPDLRLSSLSLRAGDSLAFFTDGLRPEFVDQIDWRQAPEAAAARILGAFSKGWDDALLWFGRLSE